MSDSSSSSPSYVVGIDIGTTTIKICAVDIATRKTVQTLSKETKASMVSDLGHLGNEQDVHKICLALQVCLSKLDRDIQARTVRIGISGQMHGVMLWKKGESFQQNSFSRFEVSTKVGSLITWQDGRCSTEFLNGLPKPQSHLRLSTGHGCATLMWLKCNSPEYLSNYDAAGTIQDFVVAMLCDLDTPVMSPQNAASWGYFDTVTNTWNLERLRECDFPIHMLPIVIDHGSTAGKLQNNWYLIPKGVSVEVALGDMQCSVYSILKSHEDAVLNISTSAQLSFIMPEGFTPAIDLPPSAIEYFPYFNGRYLAVAASLNGGNVMAAFVKMLQQWTHELGLGVPEDKIWQKIVSVSDDSTTSESDLVFVPTLFGERHLPDQRASVQNIGPLNISLGKVAEALYRGIIKNLLEMMSREKLMEVGITRILGTGSALTRNKSLKNEVEHQFNLPVVYPDDTCHAAVGAALVALLNV